MLSIYVFDAEKEPKYACQKVIDEDDIEAIEVLPPQQRRLYPYGKEEFRPSQVNEVDENQNLHYCGECKEAFYDILG